MLTFLEKYFSELWLLMIEMAPWLLLGIIFAGILKVYFPQKHIDRYMGKSNFRSALNASLIGIPMPLCSCGVIPTGISFFRNGASKGATNSFFISTPQTGVDSILATYSMLGWPFALLRPFVALISGVAGGVFTNIFVKENSSKSNITSAGNKTETFIKTNPADKYLGDNCEITEGDKKDKRHSVLRAADYAFIELLQDIAKWLIIGFMLAALISVALPDNFFSSFQGLGMLEMLVILAASMPVYICATGSIPVAAVLLMKGVSPGAALVFLMAGPATNIATMTVLGKTMGRKSLIAYMTSIIGGAILFGFLVNKLIPADWILSKVVHIHEGDGHQMLPDWLMVSSAILLLAAIVGGFIYSTIKKRRKMTTTGGVTVKVTGMTCSHCEATVKKNLESLRGITNVVADNRNQQVIITGPNIDLIKVKETINGLGYNYIG